MTKELLNNIGQFSAFDTELFEKHTSILHLNKNEVLLEEGEICKSFYFILSGSCYQFSTFESEEVIIDLHLPNEWMFNQQSLTEQLPSGTTLMAFTPSEILELSLNSFHALCTMSTSFLQFGKILNQTKARTSIYDNSFTPTEKYKYINTVKPELVKIFPLKMIASYLKVTPETISRIRANF